MARLLLYAVCHAAVFRGSRLIFYQSRCHCVHYLVSVSGGDHIHVRELLPAEKGRQHSLRRRPSPGPALSMQTRCCFVAPISRLPRRRRCCGQRTWEPQTTPRSCCGRSAGRHKPGVRCRPSVRGHREAGECSNREISRGVPPAEAPPELSCAFARRAEQFVRRSDRFVGATQQYRVGR